MAGKLSDTGDRVDATRATLDGVDLGPQAMGLVGQGFAGAARDHVQAARDQVDRTRTAVQNAQKGTQTTAQTYRDREDAATRSMESIDPDVTPPTPRGDTSTSPSAATTQPGGPSQPPPQTHGDSGGTSPSGTDSGGSDSGGPNDPPRPPSTPPPGDGGWHGEGGLSLTPAQNAAADDFLRRAQGAEPRITQSMQDISSSVPGSQLVGLDYRLKSEDSFKRKLATSIIENPDLTMSEHLADMKDSVRYTMRVDQDYGGGVQHAVDTLQAQGYEPVKFKNTWGGDGYQGINSMWRDPSTGQVFEVQFHTAESFDAKMVTHDLYEQARLPGVSEAERARLNEQQAEIFRNVPIPPGAENIRPT